MWLRPEHVATCSYWQQPGYAAYNTLGRMKYTLADLKRLIEVAETARPDASAAAWISAATLADEPNLAETADGAYLLGYVQYQLGSSSQGATSQAARLFRSALEIEPGHAYAQLYLAHIAYDEESFAEALSCFSALEPTVFSRNGQPWRDVKRQELRICCLLHLQQVEGLIHEFEQYLQIAAGMEATDTLVVQELPNLLQRQFRGGEHAA